MSNQGPPASFDYRPTSVWSRLQLEGQFVGFKRSVGATQLYSKDGYAWSGESIPFDLALIETGLRDKSSARIYHGDIVSVRLTEDAPCLERVLLVDAQRQLFYADIHEGKPAPWQSALGGARAFSLVRTGRSVFDHSAARLPRMGTFRRFGWSRPSLHREGAALAASMFSMSALFALTQWNMSAEVGPLIGLLGALIGCVLYMAIRRRQRPGFLTRAKTLGMAPYTSLYVGGAAAMVPALTWSEGASQDGVLWVSMLGIGVLGALVGVILPLVVGDSLGFDPDDVSH